MYLSYTSHLPRDGTTHQLVIKKMFHRHALQVILMQKILSCGSLFPDASSLFKIDKNCQHNWPLVNMRQTYHY